MGRFEKLGYVAVLIHPAHGAGWSTSALPHERDMLLFDPDIVEIVLECNKNISRDSNHMKQLIHQIGVLKSYESCLDGADCLHVAWVPKGSEFIVREYDGYETIEFNDQVPWITA